jgi:thioredoxin-dependent peroxiredoxin
MEEGVAAPKISLISASGKKITLEDFHGKWVVLYFYPKDDTPGCTREACAFRDNFKRIEALNGIVLGVSPDDVRSHDKFTNKYTLPFILLADTDHDAAEKFGVWKEKNMYGRKVMGIERSTFLINPVGLIHKTWRKVKVENHVDEIVDELRLLNA